MFDWLRRLFQRSGTENPATNLPQPWSLTAEILVSRTAEAMENAWWKGQTSLVDETDEQFAVVKPGADVTTEGLRLLGQRLKEWQQANSFARHIWGLEDLLEGRGPRTPPVYLSVPYPVDRFEECYEAVALVFVAAATDHRAAGESLTQALGELLTCLACFSDPMEYSRWNR